MGIPSATLDGLLGAESRFERAATRLGKLDQIKPESSGDSVDLTTEIVNLASARNDYEANLKSLQASDQMTRRTLDILA